MLAGAYLLLLSKEGDNEVTNWSPWPDRWQPRSVLSVCLFLFLTPRRRFPRVSTRTSTHTVDKERKSGTNMLYGEKVLCSPNSSSFEYMSYGKVTSKVLTKGSPHKAFCSSYLFGIESKEDEH